MNIFGRLLFWTIILYIWDDTNNLFFMLRLDNFLFSNIGFRYFREREVRARLSEALGNPFDAVRGGVGHLKVHKSGTKRWVNILFIFSLIFFLAFSCLFLPFPNKQTNNKLLPVPNFFSHVLKKNKKNNKNLFLISLFTHH